MGLTGAGTCSFCGKTPGLARVVAGPDGVFICNECVALCVEIFKENRISVALPRVRGIGGRLGRVVVGLQTLRHRDQRLGVSDPEIRRRQD